jgi:hypothetical protein
MSVIACETCVKADVCKYRQEFEDYCLEIEALVNKNENSMSPFTFEAKCSMCLSMAITQTTIAPDSPWNTFYRNDITMCNNGGH